MPVILRPEQEAHWLDLQYREQEQLAGVLVPYEDGMLEMYRVSEEVNLPRHNDKHLVEAVSKQRTPITVVLISLPGGRHQPAHALLKGIIHLTRKSTLAIIAKWCIR